MIFLLFLSPKKMIYSHHLLHRKIIYSRKEKGDRLLFSQSKGKREQRGERGKLLFSNRQLTLFLLN